MGKETVDTEHLFDDILDRDEHIVKIIKPNKKRFWRGMCFPLMIPIFWPHVIIIMAVTLFFTLPLYYSKRYKNMYYAYTNKRIIVRDGGVGVDYRTLDYKHITATSVNTGFLDKGLGTGDIAFKSPTTGISLWYVEKPYDLLREIKEYMEEAVAPSPAPSVMQAPVQTPAAADPAANVSEPPATSTDDGV